MKIHAFLAITLPTLASAWELDIFRHWYGEDKIDTNEGVESSFCINMELPDEASSLMWRSGTRETGVNEFPCTVYLFDRIDCEGQILLSRNRDGNVQRFFPHQNDKAKSYKVNCISG